MNNVRCVGKSRVGEPTPGNRTITKTSCGWKGERFPNAPRWRYWGALNEHSEDHPEFIAKATAKPCPRCGGRVELIPQEP